MAPTPKYVFALLCLPLPAELLISCRNSKNGGGGAALHVTLTAADRRYYKRPHKACMRKHCQNVVALVCACIVGGWPQISTGGEWIQSQIRTALHQPKALLAA